MTVGTTAGMTVGTAAEVTVGMRGDLVAFTSTPAATSTSTSSPSESEADARASRVLIERALAGDPASVRALVNRLSPVIARRVGATLWRRCGRINVAQEITDMSQEVFLSLFQSDGKALRAWDPARGMALDSFVSLLAHRQVVSLLRNRKTAPWRDDPISDDELERLGARDATPESVVACREHLLALLDRLRETLSPRGLELFHRIMVNQEPIDRLAATTGLTPAALYQWRRRLKRAVHALAAAGAHRP